jgi:hypothetical protein
MKQTTENYAGYSCVKLENESLQLWVTQDAGPRIIGLQLPGGRNLFAELPHRNVTTPGGSVYQLRGGHRFWYAPEDVERTYLPDDTAVTITPIPNGIQITQAVEPGTGIEKEMRIVLPDNSPSRTQWRASTVIVDHTLFNRGEVSAVELAPWAITQLRTGGFAILPQSTDNTGLLPNRHLVLWPYTRINSPQLQLGDEFIFVHATMQNEKLKLGWANPEGWLAYWIDNTLFVKQAQYQEDAVYYDFGSSSECYCDDDFLELETLGPRTALAPGASVTHREVWHVYPDVSFTAEETAVKEAILSTRWDFTL